MSKHTRARLARATVQAVSLLVALAAPAAAHVTVDPSEAPRGGFTTLTFRVPNESDTASTTRVRVIFPDDVDLSMRTKPVPGWTAEVERRGEGAVASITWSGGSIAPGEFQEFDVSGGPLPDDADAIQLLAEQTYDDGEVVRWFDPVVPGEEEPEHPAPTLTLVDAEGAEVAADPIASTEEGAVDDAAEPLAAAALVVAIAALVVALLAMRRGHPAI